MLRQYLTAAMQHAQYETIPEDGSTYGSIPGFVGLWANAPTLEQCRAELASTLEDWVVLGLQLSHDLPEVEGVSIRLPQAV